MEDIERIQEKNIIALHETIALLQELAELKAKAQSLQDTHLEKRRVTHEMEDTLPEGKASHAVAVAIEDVMMETLSENIKANASDLESPSIPLIEIDNKPCKAG
jgi:hypothetical protein